MDLILTCINVLLIILIWTFCVRKTILDHHRDALFNLRDELRAAYVKEGWSLEDPIYRHLRNLLNGSLRFTENYSFISFVCLKAKVQSDAKLSKYLKEKLEKEFKSQACSEMQFKYMKKTRAKATEIIQSYMIICSGWLLVTSLFLVPFIAVSEFIALMRRGVDGTLRLVIKKLINLIGTLSILHREAIGKVAPHMASPDLVEEYSYRLGLQTC